MPTPATATAPRHQTQILQALMALKHGDFSARLPVDWTGINGKIADTLNQVLDLNEQMATAFTRVSHSVGKEGKIDQRVAFHNGQGLWGTVVESVNTLIEDLVRPTSEMARVIGAVADGDLSQTMAVEVDGKPLQGQFHSTAKTVNTMVHQLNSFASEVTRVAREVGVEGKLGGQAEVTGVAGTWKDLTDSVNMMAGNLTGQVRNIAEVTTAVANGDLSKKITVDVRGEILDLKNTINVMVDQLRSFASEVTRVAREVGTEGKLGGQAEVKGVAGTWKDLTDSVNMMAGNLTGQVRNIADVSTAIANGDLSKKITVDVKGEILDLKNTINVMVDQLNSFASEVTRVAREVGVEGKLGGQAEVKGVAGTWKDLTDSVNMMAGNLTGQVRNIAEVTTAVANGDLSKKITVDVRGEILELKDTINVMVDQLRSFASEVTRVAREVGTEGKLGGQAYVPGVAGTWKDLTDNVNMMAGNLTGQVRNIAEVSTAIANGNLSKKITVDVKGEILELKNTINIMVDQLNSFASEVTRVAREVGTEGKLGGQADVKGVSGTWKDLTDNVNLMAANLTGQVRGIAKVVTGVANGDLKQKLTVDAKGEIAALADTINGMIDTLATFAEQVTSVAREVGVEGKLGGQASVPGAAGTWRDLTDNVNGLAANLTNQVRAIAEVATAVTKGDLTRSVRVDASGEVAVLKDNINEMIRNLRDTTQKNSEQDWLKTNLAKFTRMLPGQKDLLSVTKLILSELAPLVAAQHGVFYVMADAETEQPHLKLLATYAYKTRKHLGTEFALGEGLVGQCALEKERILLTKVPSDYVQINSGLGEAPPRNIIVLPVLFEGQVKAVVELASFQQFSLTHQAFLEQLTESIGIVLNTIEANMRTEELLKQSQSLASELQSRQEELQQTNAELEEKARLLATQNSEVERKNYEVEQAKHALEDKATQLALTSKYKSEFLANMSHELRTPLNSLLLLAHQLATNPDGNLSAKQVEFAQAIHAAGSDLMALINDILDLAKIESGTATVELDELPLSDVHDVLERSFRHLAEVKGLAFSMTMDPQLPPRVTTDQQRLLQVLKNLVANAVKFTEHGTVSVHVAPATSGWSADHETLNRAQMVIAFSVRDTGIGIPTEKQQLIFEAFQQADGTTNRKYGGTGLGLSISREIARLLGGEIRLQSMVGQGSTFTLYVPLTFSPKWTTDGKGMRAGRPVQYIRTESVSSARPLTAWESEVVDDRHGLAPDDRVVLIVENDVHFARTLLEILHEQGVKGVIALGGAQALALARHYQPAAITLDLLLPDVDGWTVLDLLKRSSDTQAIPVHILTVVGDEGERGVQSGAASYLVKPVKKEALQHLVASLPATPLRSTTAGIEAVVAGSAPTPQQDPVLAGKKVLIVDDDVRNLFALTSALEPYQLEVIAAESGTRGLAVLQETPDIAAVLMDIMMPGLDGYQTIRAIRDLGAFARLPIIAVTAKAMKEDRDKCLAAGASDYLAKPVNVTQLLSRLRMAVAATGN